MDKPFVSVIMCTYNTKDSFFKEAVDSILSQTYRDLEFIIVDDYSDAPVSIDSFNDERIILIRNEKNVGPGLSRQKAINMARGKYIILMDSDDISLKNRIEIQVEFMELNKNCCAAGSWFKFFGEKNHEVKRIIDNNEKYRCSLFFDNTPTLLNPSVIIRRSALLTNGINFEDMRYAEDYMLWVRLSEHGVITNINKVLLNYRVHSRQLSNFKKTDRSLNDKKKVFDYQISRIDDSGSSGYKAFHKYVLYRKVCPRKLRNELKAFINLNSKSHFFDSVLFEETVEEKWYEIIRKSKNPFILLAFLFVDKETRKIVFKSIKHRLKREY